MDTVLEYLKNASKQLIVGLIVAAIVFFTWPGATTLFFAGMVVGILAGNFYPAIERLAEKAIAKTGKKPKLPG